jgi:pyruvate/2-oxoglutarate dehydrogenase complex dihydrolipoamide acyltransferase (E2) component
MKIKVNFPKPGMGIAEGTVLRWLKSVGDKVRKGEPLVEMESEKATQEVEAPADGILSEILAPQGATVVVNSALGMIEEDRE